MPAFKENKHVRAPSSDARTPVQSAQQDELFLGQERAQKGPSTPPVPFATTPCANEGVSVNGHGNTHRSKKSSRRSPREKKIRSPREEPAPPAQVTPILPPGTPLLPPGTPPVPKATTPHTGQVDDLAEMIADEGIIVSGPVDTHRSQQSTSRSLKYKAYSPGDFPAIQENSNTRTTPAADLSAALKELAPSCRALQEDQHLQGGKTFTVKMNKLPGVRFGIRTCWADGVSLVICAIFNDGLVNEYNSKQPANPIEVGDRIVGINGETLPLEKLKDALFHVEGEFSFKIQSRTQFIVNVFRESRNPVGLDVSNRSYDDTLLVNAVLPGLIFDWNNSSNGYRVSQGDRIVAVNGARGPGSLLRQLVKEARGKVSLTVVQSSQDREYQV